MPLLPTECKVCAVLCWPCGARDQCRARQSPTSPQDRQCQLVDGEFHQGNCAIRSSIKSRSTSQYLSDDRRRLSISSASADSSASPVSGHNAPERLLDVCDLHLGFGIRQPPLFGRAFIKQFFHEWFAER